MIKNQKTFTFIKTALCFLFGLLFILPVLLIVMNALKPNGEILTSFISFPSSLYLDNFAQAMETMNFGVVFKNTVFVTVCTVFLSGTVSFFGAYGISHLKGKASDRFYILFRSEERLILFNSGFFTAFGIMTYVGFLKTVPRELEEAAAIDGAAPFRIMMQIVFPLVKSTSVTLGILFFLWTWNDLLLPNILISDGSLRTITVNLYMFKSATNAQWNLLIAGLVVSMVPIIVIYIAGQKYITSGLTAGAIK